MAQDGYQSTDHQAHIPVGRKEGVVKKGVLATFRVFLKRCTGYFYSCPTVQKLAVGVPLAAREPGVFILSDYIPNQNLGFIFFIKVRRREHLSGDKLASSFCLRVLGFI